MEQRAGESPLGQKTFLPLTLTWLLLKGSRQTAQFSASIGWDESHQGLGWQYVLVFREDILLRMSCLDDWPKKRYNVITRSQWVSFLKTKY
jgi:hypothetical protein